MSYKNKFTIFFTLITNKEKFSLLKLINKVKIKNMDEK